MMLTNLAVENFRALRSISVPMRPLTILIGPNDSGKSSFLAAIRYLREGMISANIDIADRWRNDKNLVTSVTGAIEVDSDDIRMMDCNSQALFYHAVFSTRGGCVSRPEINPISSFQLPVKGVPTLSLGTSDDQGPPTLGEDGSGLPVLLDYFLRRDRRRFFSTVKELNRLVPGFQDVEIATPEPAQRRLDLIIEDGLRIPADQVSAGVRLLMFFVALAHHPKPPKLILLEEPETGIHPKRVAEVMALLRGITKGSYGGPAAQVVLTTHSPYLLDFVDLDTDQVLIFRREDDGSRTAEPVDVERLKVFLDEHFLLGEVWFNQGEEGLVANRT